MNGCCVAVLSLIPFITTFFFYIRYHMFYTTPRFVNSCSISVESRYGNHSSPFGAALAQLGSERCRSFPSKRRINEDGTCLNYSQPHFCFINLSLITTISPPTVCGYKYLGGGSGMGFNNFSLVDVGHVPNQRDAPDLHHIYTQRALAIC